MMRILVILESCMPARYYDVDNAELIATDTPQFLRQLGRAKDEIEYRFLDDDHMTNLTFEVKDEDIQTVENHFYELSNGNIPEEGIEDIWEIAEENYWWY